MISKPLLKFRQLPKRPAMHIETTAIILSEQRITKALITLRGCADGSALLLFEYGNNRLSHDVTQFTSGRSKAVFIFWPIMIAIACPLFCFSSNCVALFRIVWWKYTGEELSYWLAACFVLC